LRNDALRRSLVYGLMCVSLGAAILLHGGEDPRQWAWCALGISVAAILAMWPDPPWSRTPQEPFGFAILVLLAAWMLLQIVPLPPALLARLAPLRWQAVEAARAATGQSLASWAALSAAPGASSERLLDIFPALAACVTARQIGWWCRDRIWIAFAPIVGMAWIESLAGLLQFSVARSSPGVAAMATGSYVYHNHFSALLEMAFPLAAMWAVWEWRKGAWQVPQPVASAAKTAALLAVAACLLLGIVVSLSRMGFISTLSAVCLTLPVALVNRAAPRRTRRARPGRPWLWAVPLALIFLLALILPPKELLARFSEIASERDLGHNVRLQIWGDTAHLIAANRWTGVGVGAYQHALYPYKTAMPLNTVDFAHNDYLQFLAELGIVGTALVAAAVVWVLAKTVAIVLWLRGSPNWEFAAGLLCSFLTLGFHSLADFMFYLPANALVVAWLTGLAVSPGLKGR
jgi:O-antigen ligase